MTSHPDGKASDLAGLRIREAVRALVLDPADRVLLVRFEFPDGTRWALPGGGVEPGETDHDALHRELAEELGLTAAVIGPHVWDRVHVIPFLDGKWDGQRERIYVVRTAAFEPTPHLSWDELHAEHLFELRWWPVQDLPADLPVAPRQLHAHLQSLLRDGPPNRPVDVGI